MKRLTIILLALSMMCMEAFAYGVNDRIPLMPYVNRADKTVGEKAQTILHNRLTSLAAGNGFAASAGNFVLTASAEVIDMATTSTIPVKFVCELELEIYVIDNTDRVIMDQMLLTLKGVGDSEQDAIVNAIGQFNVRDASLRGFMGGVRSRILDYYALRLTHIIAQADSYASSGNYSDAIAVLSTVPNVLDDYPRVCALMADYYISWLDADAKSRMAAADAYLAMSDKENALYELMMVNPHSSLFDDAVQKIRGIGPELPKEAEVFVESSQSQHSSQEPVATVFGGVEEEVYEQAVELGENVINDKYRASESDSLSWFFE